MKKLLILTLTALALISSASAQFLAGTDFTADLPEYQAGFTLTDNSNSITAVGSDAIGNSFSLYFDTEVDMSALGTSNSASLEFVANPGHSANSSFSISLFDSGFAASYDLAGFNFSDSSLVGTGSNGGVNLSAIAGMTITTGGLTGSPVNVDVSSFTVVPEPSTYALIAGFAAFLFVAIRRRK
ncbi:MAG: PEP-CTERM sorting domain-containing protein [Coraliomargaritaceae bacterium]